MTQWFSAYLFKKSLNLCFPSMRWYLLESEQPRTVPLPRPPPSLFSKGGRPFLMFKVQVSDSRCALGYLEDFLLYDSCSFFFCIFSYLNQIIWIRPWNFLSLWFPRFHRAALLIHLSPGIAIASPASLMVINQTLVMEPCPVAGIL